MLLFAQATCCQKVFNIKKLVDSVKSRFGFPGKAQPRPSSDQAVTKQGRRKPEAISKVVS